MKVLIAGATGFIGKKLGCELVKRGHEIHILTRSVKEASGLPFACEVFQWQPEENQISIEALNGVDVVVNLAGTSVASKRWSEKVKESILTSRLMSTQTLWTAIHKSQEHRIQTYISAGAIGIYGDGAQQILDENSPVGGGFLADVCHRWEKSVLKGPENIRKVIVRIGIVLGKDGGALQEMLPIFKNGLGGKLGSGNQWMSWIHLEDLIKIFIFAIESPQVTGQLNATAPNPVQNREFTKVLANVLRRPAIVPVPSLALKVALGEMSELLLSSQRVSSKKLEAFGFKFKFNDLKAALQALFAVSS